MTPPINSVSDHILQGIAAGDLAASPFEVVSIAKELAARRAANTPVDGVRVKPLEWAVDDDRLHLVAHSAAGRYAITVYQGMEEPARLYAPTWPERKPYRTVDEAKAAAQADFNARIQSCLTSPAAEPVAWSIPAHAKWCQPGDQQDKRMFLVRFDDPDCRDSVFTDEAEARAFYAKATVNWNCYLFGALEAHPDPSASREVTDPLDALAKHPSWEIDYGPSVPNDEESDYAWRVFEVSGNVNDREWTLLGFGNTPRAALLAALPEREG